MTCVECTRYLAAYVDGELDARTSIDVEDHVRSEVCPACARAFEVQQALQQQLRAQAPRFTAPEGFDERLARALRQAPGSARGGGAPRRFPAAATIGLSALAGAAAATLVLALGFGAGGDADGEADGKRRRASAIAAAEIAGAHLRSLQADHLLDVASSDRHTVKPWFQGRVDFTVTPADLGAQGFVLAGGRSDYVGGQQAAALVYKKDQHVMNVLCWSAGSPGTAAAGAAPPPDGAWRGFTLASFQRGDVACTVVADASAASVNRLRDLLAAAQ